MKYCGQQRRSRIIALIWTALIALAFQMDLGFQPAAASETAQHEEKLKDPQFIAEGGRLFAAACSNAYCHDAGGAGGVAPRVRGRDLPTAYLFKAVSNGIPGTTMLSFKSEFSEEQIWQLVAFMLSGEPPASFAETRASPIIGAAEAGKALFFDPAQSKSCKACHTFEGEGAQIGPDLSKVGRRSSRDLFLSIVLTRQTKNPRYAKLTITLRNGDKIVGIKKEEDSKSIRLYDTTQLPAVLRAVPKADIVNTEIATESVMPKDYAAVYSLKQLLDLVTFLKSSDPKLKSPLTLRDLF